MTAVQKLSDELAFKAQVSALTRDYVCEPHIGMIVEYATFMPRWGWNFDVSHLSSEYRTVAGVSGPLVVVECVKVGSLQPSKKS
jgi:V-type H+-transporting ATPase subunit B